MVNRALVWLVVAAACQGQGKDTSTTATGSAPPKSGSAGFGRDPNGKGSAVVVDLNAGSADPTGSDTPPDPARPKPEEPDIVDGGKQIAELGAIPAWQAVVDRAQYLARRGQHGVIYGVLGPHVLVLGPTPEIPPDAGVGYKPIDAGMVESEYVWLVDDTEGNGALAVRALLGSKGASVKAGDRVALGGAWALDEDRRWYWKVDAVSPLAPGPTTDLKDPPSPPGLVVRDGNLIPGAKMLSFAKDGDAIIFQLVGAPPPNPGEGWPIANELGDPVFALLNLPGERASYGAQDMRSPEERWQLKRAQTYVVRIGKIRKKAPDKPALINARTAPIRVM